MRYRIKNSRSDIQPVIDKMAQSCREQGISDEAIHDLNLVLEEILTNIIKYSFGDALEHEIMIEMKRDAGSLQFRIEDDGKPFDPLDFYNPDIEEDFDDRRIGGMGIHLIRSLTDEMKYEFIQGRNILIVKKNLH